VRISRATCFWLTGSRSSRRSADFLVLRSCSETECCARLGRALDEGRARVAYLSLAKDGVVTACCHVTNCTRSGRRYTKRRRGKRTAHRSRDSRRR
jgi:hypothetical protein